MLARTGIIWHMSERNEVSLHEVRVFKVLQSAGSVWLSNRDIADRVEGVMPRTVRAHTLKLVKLGLVDQAEVFPAHRYRLAATAAKRNRAYMQRIEAAASVFGLVPSS